MTLRDTQNCHQHQLADFGRLGHTATPEQDLAQIEQQIATIQQRLAETREGITQLEYDLATAQPDTVHSYAGLRQNSPAGLGQARGAVHAARANSSAERVAKQQAAQHETAHWVSVASTTAAQERLESSRRQDPAPTPARSDHSIGR